jgi:hypothetical protein
MERRFGHDFDGVESTLTHAQCSRRARLMRMRSLSAAMLFLEQGNMRLQR